MDIVLDADVLSEFRNRYTLLAEAEKSVSEAQQALIKASAQYSAINDSIVALCWTKLGLDIREGNFQLDIARGIIKVTDPTS